MMAVKTLKEIACDISIHARKLEQVDTSTCVYLLSPTDDAKCS